MRLVALIGLRLVFLLSLGYILKILNILEKPFDVPA